MQSAYAAQQIGEALEVAGFLQLFAAHHRREAHDFRFRVALPRDVRFETLDDLRIQRGARIHPVDTHGSKQARGDCSQRIGGMIERGGRTAGGMQGGFSH